MEDPIAAQVTASNTNPTSSIAAAALLNKLETLLRDKANEIHLAGQLGSNLLAQQTELEARVREIAELHQSLVRSPSSLDASTGATRRARGGVTSNGADDSSDGEDKAVGAETKKRLDALENELRQWDESNQPLYQTVGMAAARGIPDIDSNDLGTIADANANDEAERDVFMSPPRKTTSMQQKVAPPASAPNRGRGLANTSSASIPPVPSLSQSTTVAGATTAAASGHTDAASSRRARNNAQHRNNDIELATEIGQSLLGEVRRLQALLSEKEEHMRDGLRERDALESELENERSIRRTVEESVEKYKEENWNLELVTQDLRTNLTDSQSLLQKAELERQRALRDLATTRETLDTQRSEAEKLAQQLEAFKQKHETDLATMRKQTAGLQRDKSDLQGTLEGLKTELATRARGIKRAGSAHNLDPSPGADDSFEERRDDLYDDEEGDVFRGATRRKTGDGFPPGSPADLFSEYGDDSVAGSPVQRGGFLSTPDDSHKAGLAHAQRTIATLRASLAREKAAKMELRRQLADSGIAWEEETDAGEGHSTRHSTPARNAPGSARGSVRGSARGRGAARRRGGVAVGVPSRLRQDAGDCSIDESEENGSVGGEAMGSFDRASLFEHQFPSVEDEYSEVDSPIRHNRDFSLDDANPLSEDDASIRSRRSSLRQTTNLGDVLGGLSNDNSHRRTSLVSLSSTVSAARESMRALSPEPEMTAIAPVGPAKHQIVWTDCSTMTDPLAEPIAPEPVTVTVYVPAPIPDSTEIGVQTEPLPVPASVTVVEYVEVPAPVAHSAVMVDMSGQTDPAPVAPTKETAVTTDPITMTEASTSTDRVVLSEMQVQTDPVPTPAATVAVAPSSVASPQDMEDKALSSQASLTGLNIGKIFSAFSRSGSTPSAPASIPRSATESTIDGFRTANEATEDETETETETDSDFEDARETIGATSPFLSTTHSRSESVNDFVSIRSSTSASFNAVGPYNAVKSAEDSDYDDNTEILRTPLTPKNGREWTASRETFGNFTVKMPTKVTVHEVGVQTEAYAPPVVETPRPRTPITPMYGMSNRDRDSINTFGRADTPDNLSDAAARASSFVQGTYTDGAPRPESAMSGFSQYTTDAGSAPPLSPVGLKPMRLVPEVAASRMGPPPTPVRRSHTLAGTPGRPAVAGPRHSNLSSTSHSSLRAPPRPTSPPPADLLHRAQSPAFDEDYARRSSTLLVPGTVRSTPSRGSSLQNLRPQQSMTQVMDRKSNDYKSRSNTISRAEGAGHVPPLPSGPPLSSSARSISEMSMHSEMSRRPSMASSRTSEGGLFDAHNPSRGDEPLRNGDDSTDPAVIHAITQTMIGEFLYKYTRRAIGKGISEKRHKRFFWVHPYTKTLYWSTSDPGGANTNQSSAKSVCIEGVRQVLDANPLPPGLHQGSIIVQTPNREMKITASTRERHDMWFAAISYLLARPDPVEGDTTAIGGASNMSPSGKRSMSHLRRSENEHSMTPNARMYNLGGSASESRLTPKATSHSRLGGTSTMRSHKLSSTTFNSTYKRSGTPANDYQRYNEFGSPRSARTLSFLGDESVEFVDRRDIPAGLGDEEVDETWEGLENVRACCDGKHDVGSLSRRSGSSAHHPHHHHHSHSSRRSGLLSDAESRSMPPSPGYGQRSRSKSALGTVGSTFSRRLNDSSSTSLGSNSRSGSKTSATAKAGPPVLAPATPLAPITMNVAPR
ncbi:BQ5605_C001g00194 [Microbotryum silenes-dioicae]|uniref:BQ5605_C001g00194 protein n=1 Tax=Microbotryum silenes-dioicae TaxID=796604 RepID=A0A2X0MX16_9BASI|nr:BQ5605_C001g00194 [Microbotryum silenes-dioicae]